MGFVINQRGSASKSKLRSPILTLRDITRLRGAIEQAPSGALPNDCKVIDDARSYK